MDANIRDIVLKLYQEGYSIIPSGKGAEGKAPAVPWADFQEKLPSEEQLRGWLRQLIQALWGLVTGKLSGVVVVDADAGADLTIMGDLKPHIKTPHGQHYWFAYPGHHVKTCTKILPGWDIRGDGGFANFIGFNPVTGGEYTIEIMPTRDALYSWEMLPKQILDALEKTEKPEVKLDEPGGIIPEGKRNEWLFHRACGYRTKGDSEDVIFQKVKIDYEQRCAHDPQMGDKELRACCHSAAKYEPPQKVTPAPPEIISARKLDEIDFPELKFALPGLIPEGLSILAGKPKQGKSWFALQAAYSVALGKNLLDGSKIERGRALVLGLEDGQRRLQSRIRKLNSSDVFLKVAFEEGKIMIKGNLGEDIPEGLDLAVSWPKIEEGGIEELEKYLNDHPDTHLIVVDIIKRIQKKKGKGTTYDEDYQSIQPLQELATRRRVAILGVHHVRKALSDDPLDMVSGTFGLTGGVDNILVMQREQDDFRLSVQGRDVEASELAIRFEDCLWKLMGNAGDFFISEEREAIINCLDDQGRTPKEIATILEWNRATVRSLLSKMLKDGQVHKDKDDKYSRKKPEREGLTNAKLL